MAAINLSNFKHLALRIAQITFYTHSVVNHVSVKSILEESPGLAFSGISQLRQIAMVVRAYNDKDVMDDIPFDE